jgi:hypothetical protein
MCEVSNRSGLFEGHPRRGRVLLSRLIYPPSKCPFYIKFVTLRVEWKFTIARGGGKWIPRYCRFPCANRFRHQLVEQRRICPRNPSSTGFICITSHPEIFAFRPTFAIIQANHSKLVDWFLKSKSKEAK